MIVSQTKTFFYLFSLPPDATCTHWSVDVVFEDNSHIRLDEAHEN